MGAVNQTLSQSKSGSSCETSSSSSCNPNFITSTILSKLSPWDHLPGVLIVREAGGNDQHFDGTPYQFNQKCNNLIVSNSKYLNIEIINKLKELRS